MDAESKSDWVIVPRPVVVLRPLVDLASAAVLGPPRAAERHILLDH